jgi:hypothetical protein
MVRSTCVVCLCGGPCVYTFRFPPNGGDSFSFETVSDFVSSDFAIPCNIIKHQFAWLPLFIFNLVAI